MDHYQETWISVGLNPISPLLEAWPKARPCFTVLFSLFNHRLVLRNPSSLANKKVKVMYSLYTWPENREAFNSKFMRWQIKGLFNEPAVPVSSEPCANMRNVSKNTSDCDMRERRTSFSYHRVRRVQEQYDFFGAAKFYPLLLFSDVLCRHSPWNAWSPSKGSYQITSKKS